MSCRSNDGAQTFPRTFPQGQKNRGTRPRFSGISEANSIPYVRKAHEKRRTKGVPEPVEKLTFFRQSVIFDFAKHGRPKVPMRKLSLLYKYKNRDTCSPVFMILRSKIYFMRAPARQRKHRIKELYRQTEARQRRAFRVPTGRRARGACAIPCRIPAKPEQAGQAHRSAPH